MKDQAVNFVTADGYRLVGRHTQAKGKALVLWLHGITVDMDEYLGMFRDGAEFMAARGIDSLRFSFRGHNPSQGSSREFTVVGQTFDVEAALEYLSQYYGQEHRYLTVVGCSFGAYPAIFAAQRFPDRIRSLVLVSPVLSYQRTFLAPETEWARGIFGPKGWAHLKERGELVFQGDFVLSAEMVQEMKAIAPDLVLQNIKAPTTIIHGDADSMVPYEVSVETAARTPHAALVTLHGADHGFVDYGDDEGRTIASQRNEQAIFDAILQSCGSR